VDAENKAGANNLVGEVGGLNPSPLPQNLKARLSEMPFTAPWVHLSRSISQFPKNHEKRGDRELVS